MNQDGSGPRGGMQPVKIETVDDADGETTATYIYDVSGSMLQGQTCAGVVYALADVSGKRPDQLPVLASVVDCDALNQLFSPRRYGNLRDDLSVTFPFDVYRVTVNADGTVAIEVREPDDGENAG